MMQSHDGIYFDMFIKIVDFGFIERYYFKTNIYKMNITRIRDSIIWKRILHLKKEIARYPYNF
jgi:hypothetical protein